MSIISNYEVDHSAGLAKRFAALATTYMDDPAAAKSSKAQIPLENLFRILEMYRYDAFEDEDRGGVLTLEGFGTPAAAKLFAAHSPWHLPIEAALNEAMKSVFDQGTTKEAAVSQLQEGLRQLSKEGHINDPLASRVRGFFTKFEAILI